MSTEFTTGKEPQECCAGDPAADHETYRSSFELHRATREQTVALADQLSQSEMDYVPGAGEWSIGEVLDHLILGQRLNLCYIAEVIEMKKAGRPPIRRLSFTDVDVSIGYLPKGLLPLLEFPFTMLNLFMPGSVRDFMTRNRLIPAQNPEITSPRHARPAGELRDDLIDSLEETDQLLRSNAGLDFGEMRIQHPLLGDNTIPGLLRFLTLHEQRHQSQIESILRSPGFLNRFSDVKFTNNASIKRSIESPDWRK